MKKQSVPHNFRETNRKVSYIINAVVFYYDEFTTKRFFKNRNCQFRMQFRIFFSRRKQKRVFPEDKPNNN